MARIVVTGYMIRYPLAGNLLAFMHYLLGLSRLGHQVAYFEESGWPYSCYDPGTREWRDEPASGLLRVRALLKDFKLDIPICFVHRDKGEIYGADWAAAKALLSASDLLLNIGGVSWLPEFNYARRRALIDMDPLFTQLGRFGAEILDDHHVHFSYGANIGRPGCTVPPGSVHWHPLAPPVVPELWENLVPDSPDPDGNGRSNAVYTTIANWSAYKSISQDGRHYGQKDEEFLRIIDLPGRIERPVEVALSGAGQDIEERFRSAGWLISSAEAVSADFPTYRAYIAGSRGEFSVAKHAYVETRSGWFSDRSVCYLAAGLPVILQESGFSDWLPTGRGLMAFSSLDEAVDCIERTDGDYARHRAAAREIAKDFFDYRPVLGGLCDTALRDASRVRGRAVT